MTEFACTCRRHAVNPECPKHGGYLDDFRTIAGKPSVMDDPEWKKADRERWDRRKASEAA